MKKAIWLFFTLALLLGVSAVASADTLTLPYSLTSGSIYKDAHNTWATFSVDLASGDQLPADISSYNPTSLTLKLDVVDPYATWKVKVGDANSSAYELTKYTYTVDANNSNDGTLTFNLSTSDFQGTSYNWYDAPITFSAYATGCHVTDATYTVDATPTSTPEPGTILLLGLGLAGLAIFRMKSRRALTTVS